MPVDEEKIDRDRQTREAAAGRLREYVKQVWHVLEPTHVYVHGWHIDAICEHLEAVSIGQIRNLMIMIQPRHMKSLLASVMWPTWDWIKSPSRRWLNASYAQSLSIRDNVKSRRVIQSPWYQNHWGQNYRLTGDQNAKERYENDRTGYRLATSVGGSATGEGGDIIVVDDAHNLKERHSTIKRETVIDWWDNVMSTRLNDPLTGAQVVIGQRCHHADLMGHIEEQGGFEILRLPTEFVPKTMCITSLPWRDPRTKAGELLWKARFPEPAIAALKKKLGSYGASAQLQHRPSPEEGGIIKRWWWKFYTERPARFDEIIQSWDMTFKDKKTCDFVVGQVWGRVGANRYLLDRVRGQLSFTATKRAVRSLSECHPQAFTKLVEDTANGPAIIDDLKSSITGLIPVNPEGDKTSRLYACEPDIEAGNVFLPNPEQCPWVRDLIEEVCSFPEWPYDDDVDSMTQALLWFRSRGITGAPSGVSSGKSYWRR